MFLHTHPINKTRQSQNLPAVNGLWLWQDLPEGQADLSDTLIFADNPCWKMVTTCLNTPDNFSTYTQWCELHQPEQKHHVILLEDALGAELFACDGRFVFGAECASSGSNGARLDARPSKLLVCAACGDSPGGVCPAYGGGANCGAGAGAAK